MHIPILTPEEQKKMRTAGRIAAKVLDYIAPFVRAGVSTEELDRLCHNFILENGCTPAPLNYHGFPKSICTSINDVICHGIPSEKDILKNGDIVNIDITVIKDGYHGDTSRMFLVGEAYENARLLVERTKKAMLRGISIVKPGIRFDEIGKTIEKYISKFEYGIVRDFTGHGIGKEFHCQPSVLHYHSKKKMPKMEAGMSFTIEPMINGSMHWESVVDKNDGWTARTIDGALSAQFEHTILVTENGHEILTLSS
jgi:methionyl aminopeptidase